VNRAPHQLLHWIARLMAKDETSCPLLAPDASGLELANDNGILPLLYRVLKDEGVYDELPPLLKLRMQEAHELTAAFDLVAGDSTRRLAEKFAEASIPAIALNGTALRILLYEPRGWLRGPGEMDLLLGRAAMEEAERLVDACGFLRLGKLPQEYYLHHHRAEPRYLPSCPALRLNLHWDMIRPPHPFHLDLDGMWTRSLPLSSRFEGLRRLEDCDFLIHSCLRIDHDENYAGMIRPIVETLAFARWRRVDGHTLSARAREMGVQKEVGRVLQTASLLLGLKAPAGLPRVSGPGKLRSRVWWELVARTLWRRRRSGVVPIWYLNYATEVFLRSKSWPQVLSLLARPVFFNPRLGGRGFVHPRREEFRD